MKKENSTVEQVIREKSTYIAPGCEVIEMERQFFLCTSVRANGEASQEDDYDPDTDMDGGEAGIDF